MELAFLTLLLKNSTDSICGGVAINDEWVVKTWLMKDQGHANGINKVLKGRLVFLLPVEFTAFSTICNERIEGSGQKTEISNVHAVEVEEA